MNGDSTVRTYKVGVDIGGTFTDVVFVGSDGHLITRKVPSTPDDYSRGILDGLSQVLASDGLSAPQVEELVHGTTVATNAILEKRGAKTALLTTAGFRDVLEIRRVRVPQLYNVQWEKPRPLVPRALRFELRERINHLGEILTPLDEQQVRSIAAQLQAEGIEAVAICLINGYANPEHELRIGAVLREMLPDVRVSLSSDITKELKEFERTSTTVIDAYVKPVVEHYLGALEERLGGAGLSPRVLIMQSNGAVMSSRAAREHPCFIIESGPAAGVIAGQAVARELGVSNVITFDMGGTTAKAATIEGGEISLTDEYEVGAGITVGSRLMKGDGYLLRIPAIDLAEVGAGGGSLAWIDSGGYLQVGPQSAGAVPGPACYGMGNTEPTITDANVVLGYINPESFAGGSLSIDPDLSWKAIGTLGARLGLPVEEAAYAVHVISNARMSRPIQAVSTERGRDVREFALLAFGGSGPIHAAQLARGLGMRTVIVPPHAGLFSALGLVFSQVGHQFVQTFHRRLTDLRHGGLVEAVESMQAEAAAQLHQLGYPEGQLRFVVSGDLRYVGQSFSLTVDLPDKEGDPQATLDELARRFEQEHLTTYGHQATTDPIELVNLRLAAIVDAGRRPRPVAAGFAQGGAAGQNGHERRTRRAYFSREEGWIETRVLARGELAQPIAGPLAIEEYDTTILVPPGASATIDRWENVVITLEG